MLNIYLDHNKWIDLARAYHGRADGCPYKSALTHSFLAVEQGRARFPLSAAHYMEMSKDRDAARRQRLARVMIQLSKGATITSNVAMVAQLIRPALEVLLGVCNDMPAMEPFGVGFNFMFGDILPEQQKHTGTDPLNTPTIQAFLNGQGVMEWMLSDPDDGERSAILAFLRAQETSMAQRIEKARQSTKAYGRNARLMLYKAGLIEGVIEEICGGLVSLGHSLPEFNNNPQRILQLADIVPPFIVEAELSVEREWHWTRKPQGNDLMDILALSMALPYCDVVITEGFWVSVIQRLGLDQKFDTIVSSDVRELESVLAL